MLSDGALVESSLPALLTWFLLVAILTATAHRVWRSFCPGGKRITPGRAPIALGLVPTGALLIIVGYLMLPGASQADANENDWDGFFTLLFIVFVLVSLIVSLLGVGLTICKKERNAEYSR